MASPAETELGEGSVEGRGDALELGAAPWVSEPNPSTLRRRGHLPVSPGCVHSSFPVWLVAERKNRKAAWTEAELWERMFRWRWGAGGVAPSLLRRDLHSSKKAKDRKSLGSSAGKALVCKATFPGSVPQATPEQKAPSTDR